MTTNKSCDGCGEYTEHIVTKTTSTCEVCGLERTMIVTDPTNENKAAVELAFKTKLKDDAEVRVKVFKEGEGATYYDVTVEARGDKAFLHVMYNHENFEVSFIDGEYVLLTEANLFRYLWLRCVAMKGK